MILMREASAEADLAYGKFIIAQERFCALDSLSKDVLVWTASHALPERSTEVKRTHCGRFR
jgi:hypothetical protein